MIKNNFEIPNHISLYIHIPFCKTKCFYCDFNTYTKIEVLIPSYIKALESEVYFWSKYLNGTKIKSIFIGGGTPSYIPENYIQQLLNTIFSKFNIKEYSEITLESNPNDLSKKKLNTYKNSGINRISMGVQSFNNLLLQNLGRRHSQENAIESYYLAKEAGFENISIDLMYGLPNQSMHQWEETLSKLLNLKPLHVSMYGLTLEEGTPMNEWVKTGQLTKPDDDLAAEMYIKAEDAMSNNNYAHYEISNWAIPGFESKHNLNYWNTYQGECPNNSDDDICYSDAVYNPEGPNPNYTRFYFPHPEWEDDIPESYNTTDIIQDIRANDLHMLFSEGIIWEAKLESEPPSNVIDSLYFEFIYLENIETCQIALKINGEELEIDPFENKMEMQVDFNGTIPIEIKVSEICFQ